MSKYTNNKIYKIEEQEFKDIIKESNNVTDALRKIGYKNPRAGRSRNTLMERIEELSINTDHFNESNKKDAITNRSVEEIFVKNSNRGNSYLKRMIKKYELMTYRCEICGNEGEWMGKKLSLQLDHKDGDNKNNLLENLRFLCPNCHTQTETYAGKNR